MIKATYFEVCYSDYFTAIAKNAVDVILFVNDPILKNRHDGFAYTKQKSLDPFLQMILNGQKFNEEMIPKRVLFAVHRTDHVYYDKGRFVWYAGVPVTKRNWEYIKDLIKLREREEYPGFTSLEKWCVKYGYIDSWIISRLGKGVLDKKKLHNRSYSMFKKGNVINYTAMIEKKLGYK